MTVAVGLPQQKLTNATVKVQVTEGRLAAIKVKGNHYFSSNNVMRALPSLHTEHDSERPDFSGGTEPRQCQSGPANLSGHRTRPRSGTSELTLKVKDRLPLHAQGGIQQSKFARHAGLRLNTSAVYDNLWQYGTFARRAIRFFPGAI